MKVLLFGANSSISKSLTPYLAKFSEVITAGRSNSDIKIDLGMQSAIKLPLEIDIIIHTAAHFGGKNIEDICDSININVIGTMKLIDAAIKAEVKRFIYISSIYAHLKPDAANYSIYSISKKYSEELLTYYCKNKSIELTILRPSQIYGDFSFNKSHHPFFYSIIDKAKKNENIVFFGSKEYDKNFIHINDVAEIITKCIVNKLSGAYDCAFPTNIKYTQIAQAAINIFNTNSMIQFDKSKPDMAGNQIELNNKLYEILNFYPSISIEDGIRMMVNENEK